MPQSPGASSLSTGTGARPAGDIRPGRTLPTRRIDVLGILAASQTLSREISLARLHTRAADVLGSLAGATGVRLLLWNDDRRDWVLTDPSGTVPAGSCPDAVVPRSVLSHVQLTRQPLVVADATADDRFACDPYLAGVVVCSLLAVPILGGGALRAVLLLENRLLPGAFTADRLDTVLLITGQLAVLLDNARLSSSRARIVAAADEARRRTERSLHDGAQQQLVSLTLRLRAARAVAPPQLAAELDEVAAGLVGALDELRGIARCLHPVALADGGLRQVLRTLARRSLVPVRLDVRLNGRLPERIELAAYHVVAEALTNAATHAQATVVDVEVTADAGALRVRVHDDGRGGADVTRGSGLVGLRDRVEALGGRLTLVSPPGAGTTLEIALPHADA